MNLTAIDDPKEIILRHFLDSSILIKIFGADVFDGKKVIDIGTGAGFPGLPLAILCPKGDFVLSDTLGKRINFLDEVLSTIGLKNVKLIKARAEDLGQDFNHREKYDFAISRAVANISVLLEYSLPLLKLNGKSLLFKMDDCDKEIKSADRSFKELGGVFHVKHSYDLINDEPMRCILEIEKVLSTPKKYPRKAGTPSKSPL